MRKIIALFLALTVVLSCAVMASAENQTVLTTSVPDASYTLEIPADMDIVYNATKTDIGALNVTSSNGFAYGKDLKVILSYTPFTNSSADEIPLSVYCETQSTGTSNTTDKVSSGGYVLFRGMSSGTVMDRFNHSNGRTSTDNHLNVQVAAADWGKALGGTYTATITFTAQVVND